MRTELSCSSWILNLSQSEPPYTTYFSGTSCTGRSHLSSPWETRNLASLKRHPVELPRFSRHAHHRLRCKLALWPVQEDVADNAHTVRWTSAWKVANARRYPLLSFPEFSFSSRFCRPCPSSFACPAEAQLILVPAQSAFEELDPPSHAAQQLGLELRHHDLIQTRQQVIITCSHEVVSVASTRASRCQVMENPRHRWARTPSESFEHSRVLLPATVLKPSECASHPEGAPPRPHQCLHAPCTHERHHDVEERHAGLSRPKFQRARHTSRLLPPRQPRTCSSHVRS